MLLATLLALGAAVLHAGWNLIAKRATGDRYIVLWTQFVAGGLLSLPLMVVYALVWGMPAEGYAWAALSGAVHLPYVWLLARAYSHGDFSVAYPVARGGGAAPGDVRGTPGRAHADPGQPGQLFDRVVRVHFKPTLYRYTP